MRNQGSSETLTYLNPKPEESTGNKPQVPKSKNIDSFTGNPLPPKGREHP